MLGGCYDDGKCKCVETGISTYECPLLQCVLLKETLESGYILPTVLEQKSYYFPLILYFIGLGLVNFDELDVYVQISPLSSQVKRYLHLNKLHSDLAADPGLAMVSSSLRAHVLQTLFICSGCDYISFFAGFGKPTIMKHSFKTHVLKNFLVHWQTLCLIQ